MNDRAKAGRLQSALTLLTEVVDELHKANEKALADRAQDIQKEITTKYKELIYNG